MEYEKISECKANFFVHRRAEIDNLSSDGLVPDEPLKGKIEFQDVRFTYPSKKDNTVDYIQI